MSAPHRSAALVGVALAVVACAVNPATGQHQLVLVSESQEIQMGQEADPSVVQTYGVYPDSGIQAYIAQLGARLAAVSERPNLQWTFRVVDDPAVNAFAIPGGFVYVTRGILPYLQSEAELASVMGHEIGHVTARHSVQQMTQQQLGQVGLIAGAILVPKASDLILGAGGAGLQLMFLKFSRDDERQADLLGLRYMSRAGYDPNQMPEVYTMLDRVSNAAGGGRLPTFFSTHPEPADRKQRIEQAIAALPAGGGHTVGRDAYLRRLDGMVLGENPREGFFRGQSFLHPDLAFRLDFPAGWAMANQKQSVVARSADTSTFMELALSDVTTADGCAQSFVMQEGDSGGTVLASTINALPAATAGFRVSNQQQVIDGSVTCIVYDGRVFRIAGFGSTQGWRTHRREVSGAIATFGPLTDRAALSVQPLRISIVALDRAMTLRQFAQRSPSQVTLDRLAILNGVDPDSVLAARTLVKRVVGGPLP